MKKTVRFINKEKKFSILHFAFCISSLFILPFSLFLSISTNAQDLGEKEYIIVKDYKPILAESYKISESPEADTSSSSSITLNYKIAPKKIETNYEAGVIKAVKLKDEPIAKLYKSLVKLGIGNYSKTYGDLFVNSTRSKTGSLGLHVHHLAGSPNLNDVGKSSFSDNSASVFGRYFLENSTFSGDVNYIRNVVYYYGYNANDPVLHLTDPETTKQRFNNFSLNMALQSNLVSNGNMDYNFRFLFHSISDLYEVTENDFAIGGTAGKMVDGRYFSLPFSFDFFKKSMASFEKLTINSNQSRYIISAEPQVKIEDEQFQLTLGLGLGLEHNITTVAHLFPKANLTIPIAQNVLTAFAGINGNIKKNNFKTITDENPYTVSSVVPFNTINKLIINGGLKGNFSNTITFMAAVNFSQVSDMQFFYNDSLYAGKFNVLSDDADVFQLHAEMSYMKNEKLNISLHVDQYSYSPNVEQQAWHKPNSIVSVVAKYNIQDRIFADVSLFAHGRQFARDTTDTPYAASKKIDGFLDANLGLEYRYTKVLSLYMHLNNLGFSSYYQWNQYPSERFNFLAGLTYAF